MGGSEELEDEAPRESTQEARWGETLSSPDVFDSTIVQVDTDDGVAGFGEVCPLGPFYLPAYAKGCRSGIEELAPHLIGESPLQLDRLNRRMDAALKGHRAHLRFFQRIWMAFLVAQIFNLLYRRFGIGKASVGPNASCGADTPQNAILRYGRLQICATNYASSEKSEMRTCWDILGKVCGQPVCFHLGGRYGDDFVLYRAISQESPEAMAARVAGYREEGYRRFQLKVGGNPDVDIERIRAVSEKLNRL